MKNEKIVDMFIYTLALLCGIFGVAMLSGIGDVFETMLCVLGSGAFLSVSYLLFKLQIKREKLRAKKYHIAQRNKMRTNVSREYLITNIA